MDKSLASLGMYIMVWVVWSSGFIAIISLVKERYRIASIAVYIFLTGLVMYFDGKGII